MDYSSLLYGPVYSVLSVTAVLTVSETFGPVDIQIIDKTDGLPAESNDSGIEIHTVKPACVIRVVDLDALGVDIATIDGGIIAFNGKTWRIESHSRLPSPGGERDGQVALWLIQGA